MQQNPFTGGTGMGDGGGGFMGGYLPPNLRPPQPQFRPQAGFPTGPSLDNLNPFYLNAPFRMFVTAALGKRWGGAEGPGPVSAPSGEQANSRLRDLQAASPNFIVCPPAPRRKRFVVEASAQGGVVDGFKSSSDVFLLSSDRKLYVAGGPAKRSSDSDSFVMAETSSEASGPDSTCRVIAVGDSIANCDEMVAWMRKKLRLRSEAESGVVVRNVICRYDVPEGPYEIDTLDLYTFVAAVFPHWTAIYDPDVAPVLVIRRLTEKTNASSTMEDLTAENTPTTGPDARSTTGPSHSGPDKEDGMSTAQELEVAAAAASGKSVPVIPSGGKTVPTSISNAAVALVDELRRGGGETGPGGVDSSDSFARSTGVGSSERMSMEPEEMPLSGPVPSLDSSEENNESKEVKEEVVSVEDSEDKLPEIAPMEKLAAWMLRCEQHALLKTATGLLEVEALSDDGGGGGEGPAKRSRVDGSLEGFESDDNESALGGVGRIPTPEPTTTQKKSIKTVPIQTVALGQYIDPESAFYSELEEWLKATIIVTSKNITIHGVRNADDAEVACFYIFPLIRRFLTVVPQVGAPPQTPAFRPPAMNTQLPLFMPLGMMNNQRPPQMPFNMLRFPQPSGRPQN